MYHVNLCRVARCSKSTWKRKRIKSSDPGCQNCQLTKMINIAGGVHSIVMPHGAVISALRVLSCAPLKLNTYRRRAFNAEAFTRKRAKWLENIIPIHLSWFALRLNKILDIQTSSISHISYPSHCNFYRFFNFNDESLILCCKKYNFYFHY